LFLSKRKKDLLMSSKDLAMPIAIKANQLGKCFALYRQPSDRLKQLLWGRFKKYTNDFWALQNICFEIHAGEIVGIVGRNGAGKSTLLQLLCGTLKPSTGKLQVTGRVAALLELGAGFNPDFTGRENVYMNAAILGLQRHEIDDRIQSIIDFAEIGEFIDQPVRTYSSGMFMRLAFSGATSSDPDILIIDEALSVGDGAFARKSFERIMSLKERGKTILFCSHAMYQVEALCSRALWLENGSIKMDGSSANVTSAYQASLIEYSPLESEDILATRLVDKDKKIVGKYSGYEQLKNVTIN
jgi:lipopolysaccharide transport system ATP-binding protein